MVEALRGTTLIEVEVVAMEEAVEVEGVAAAVTIVACLATSLQTVEMEVVVAGMSLGLFSNQCLFMMSEKVSTTL